MTQQYQEIFIIIGVKMSKVNGTSKQKAKVVWFYTLQILAKLPTTDNRWEQKSAGTLKVFAVTL